MFAVSNIHSLFWVLSSVSRVNTGCIIVSASSEPNEKLQHHLFPVTQGSTTKWLSWHLFSSAQSHVGALAADFSLIVSDWLSSHHYLSSGTATTGSSNKLHTPVKTLQSLKKDKEILLLILPAPAATPDNVSDVCCRGEMGMSTGFLQHIKQDALAPAR